MDIEEKLKIIEKRQLKIIFLMSSILDILPNN